MTFEGELERYVKERKRYGERRANESLYRRRMEAAWGVRHARYMVARYGRGSSRERVRRALDALGVMNRVSRFVSRASWIRGQGFTENHIQ